MIKRHIPKCINNLPQSLRNPSRTELPHSSRRRRGKNSFDSCAPLVRPLVEVLRVEVDVGEVGVVEVEGEGDGRVHVLASHVPHLR